MNLKNDEESFYKLAEMKFEMAEQIYRLLSNICKQNEENSVYIYNYISIFQNQVQS